MFPKKLKTHLTKSFTQFFYKSVCNTGYKFKAQVSTFSSLKMSLVNIIKVLLICAFSSHLPSAVGETRGNQTRGKETREYDLR